jgi:hypothetical protein
MTHNGQVPAASVNAYERGYLFLKGTLLGVGMLELLQVPASGPMQGSAVVPDGMWTIEYSHTATAYTGTPLGQFPIGTAQVSGSAQSVTRNLASVWVSGTVTLDGATLPVVSDPEDRGGIGFYSSFYGGGGSGWLPPFDPSGPADYGVWMVPGVYDVTYFCQTDACPSRGLPGYVSVYRAVRIDT